MASSVIDDHKTYADKVNWLKGVLVMDITDEAIRPFVETENTKFHCDIKNNFGHRFLCGRCSSISARYCSSNICSIITSQIASVHRYSQPCYTNSDITKWLSDPWEIAKNYMPKSKDLFGKAGSEIDFSNILNVVINNTRFERPAVDMTKQDNLFCKGRNARNQIMHSKSQQLTARDLNHDCDIFIDMVKQIGTKQAEYVRKIEQVRDTPLTISAEDIVKLKEDAAMYKGLTAVAIKEMKEKWRIDAERIKEEIEKVTGKSLIPSFIEGCKKAFCRLTKEHIERLKPERKHDWTVEKFLELLELQPETKALSEQYRKMLFPPFGSPMDIEQWDIYLYCFVLNIELVQPLNIRTLLFLKDAKLLRDNLLVNPVGVDKSQLSKLCDYLDNPLKDDILMIFESELTVAADMIHANNVLLSWKKEEEKEGEERYRRNQAEFNKLTLQMMQTMEARLSAIEKNNGSARIEPHEGAIGRPDETFDTKAELRPMNASPADIKKMQTVMTTPHLNESVLQHTGGNEHFQNLTNRCVIDGIAEGSIILNVSCPSLESLFGFWEGCTDGTVVKAMSKIRDAYRKYLGCDTLEFDIVLKKKEVTRCTNKIIGDLNSRLDRLETQSADEDGAISEPATNPDILLSFDAIEGPEDIDEYYDPTPPKPPPTPKMPTYRTQRPPGKFIEQSEIQAGNDQNYLSGGYVGAGSSYSGNASGCLFHRQTTVIFHVLASWLTLHISYAS